MLIDSITAVLDSWQIAEQVYRDTNNIPPNEQLSAEDWLIIEAVKQQLQMTEGE